MPRKAKPKIKTEEYEELVLRDSDYAVMGSANPRLYRNIAIGFLSSIVILGIFALFFISGQASIVLVTRSQTLSLNNIISVASQPVGANSLTGIVTATEVTGEQDFLPTAEKGAPAKAFGKVTIFNKTRTNQILVATTRLLSPDQVLFRLKKRVVVPAAGQVEAEIEADQPGLAGEIPPSHFIIPGLREAQQANIYAESTAPLIGGERKIVSLGEADLEGAKKTLTDLLFKDAQSKLKAIVQATSTAYDSAEFAVDSTDLSADKPLGATVDKFKVSGKIKVVGVFFKEADLRQYLLTGLKTGLAGGDHVDQASPVPNVKLENYDLSSGIANLRASQEIMAKLNLQDLVDKNKIAGLTVEDATKHFQSFSSVSRVSIKLQPFWINKIPKDSNQIEISVISEN